MSDDGCVFCRILRGNSPVSMVHETEDVVAFMDIAPMTPGHALVVPRRHLPSLADLTDELTAGMTAVARSVATALRRSPLRSDGVNLFLADGEAAGQEVFHAHLHVIARFPGDGFRLDVRRGATPTRADLDRDARSLRAHLPSVADQPHHREP